MTRFGSAGRATRSEAGPNARLLTANAIVDNINRLITLGPLPVHGPQPGR